jgi:hypothetical protein
MKLKIKPACLFFDQVNIYTYFSRVKAACQHPSTDLSTDFVDKAGRRRALGAGHSEALVEAPSLG